MPLMLPILLQETRGDSEDADAPSILELRGLGKELCKDVDASAHVASERRSWD